MFQTEFKYREDSSEQIRQNPCPVGSTFWGRETESNTINQLVEQANKTVF
jgi:hypothetical protein